MTEKKEIKTEIISSIGPIFSDFRRWSERYHSARSRDYIIRITNNSSIRRLLNKVRFKISDGSTSKTLGTPTSVRIFFDSLQF